MVVAIVVMAVGVSLLLGMAIMFLWSFTRKCINKPTDNPEKLRKRFRGISSNPAFAAAIHQSFTNQAASNQAILTAGTDDKNLFVLKADPGECPTCSLIAEGSSMAYSDNTCPQCGADTSCLMDFSINPYG